MTVMEIKIKLKKLGINYLLYTMSKYLNSSIIDFHYFDNIINYKHQRKFKKILI